MEATYSLLLQIDPMYLLRYIYLRNLPEDRTLGPGLRINVEMYWVGYSENSRFLSLELIPGFFMLEPERILIRIQPESLHRQKMPLGGHRSILSLLSSAA